VCDTCRYYPYVDEKNGRTKFLLPLVSLTPQNAAQGEWVKVDAASGVGYHAWVDFSSCDEARYLFDEGEQGETASGGGGGKPRRSSLAALFRYVVGGVGGWWGGKRQRTLHSKP